MNLKSYLHILTLISLAGCESAQETKTLNLQKEFQTSDEFLLTTEMLQNVSTTCRPQIEQIWQKRFSISKEKQKDFYEMMGRASEDCNTLNDAFKYLKSMSSHLTNYQQAFENAQSLTGEHFIDSVSPSYVSPEGSLREGQPLE